LRGRGPRLGTIVIATTGRKDTVEIDISDDGPGIPAMVQDSVFRPFVTYGKAEGNGLGPAIARKIVEDHGGMIRLDERCETGTSFKITIPFASQR
jgi:signal transduction histidine kinase